MSTLIQPMSPLSLDQWSRDLWGCYDAAAVAQIAPLADLDCYAPKFYKAPAAADEYMQPFANAKFGLEVTFGSLIFGVYSIFPSAWASTAAGPLYNVQVTDESLNHKFWDAPIPVQFVSNFKPTYQSTTFFEVGNFPNLLNCPYPVVGNGVFLVEIWETSGVAQRIELIFGVLERVKALSVEGGNQMAARVPSTFESQLDIKSLGPKQIRDARAIEFHVSDNQEQWPYRNLIPEPKARRVFVPGFIAAPVVNTATAVISYTVPQCFAFSLSDIVMELAGGTPNPGDFTWSLAKNTTPGTTIAYSQIIDGYLNVPFGLGSFDREPWPLRQPELFQPNDMVSIIVTNVLPVAGFFKGGLLGWLFPEMEV